MQWRCSANQKFLVALSMFIHVILIYKTRTYWYIFCYSILFDIKYQQFYFFRCLLLLVYHQYKIKFAYFNRFLVKKKLDLLKMNKMIKSLFLALIEINFIVFIFFFVKLILIYFIEFNIFKWIVAEQYLYSILILNKRQCAHAIKDLIHLSCRLPYKYIALLVNSWVIVWIYRLSLLKAVLHFKYEEHVFIALGLLAQN